MMKTQRKGVSNMAKVKCIVLDRYEQGLLVRALYDLRKKMMAEGTPVDDIEDLLLKVIDAPQMGFLARLLA